MPVERMRVTTAEEPLLVYDGECPLCTGLTRFYVRLGWVSAERRIALQDVEPELLGAFVEAGIRNEMVVYEPATRAIRTGVDGILRLLDDTWARPLARILRLPLFFQASEIVYRFVGFNRRFLSVPRPRALRCACEPDERPGYNLALCFLGILWSLSAALAFEHAWSQAFSTHLSLQRPAQQAALGLLLAVVLASFTPPLRLRALVHAATGLGYAALPLAAGAALGLVLPASLARGALWLGLGCAIVWLFQQYRRRFQYLELRQAALLAAVGASLGSLYLAFGAWSSAVG